LTNPEDFTPCINLKIVKLWVGEGGWNLNRWDKKGDVPGITKEQVDKLKLKY